LRRLWLRSCWNDTMLRIDEKAFDLMAEQVAFCLANIRHPACTIQHAGRFYEEAAEALRAHAILRLLVDANPDGFSNDLVMSAQARRGWLRRCARHQHADYFLALSRSGSMLDAVAANDLPLAAEIFALSPVSFRQGDEYPDDFWWQRFVGLLVSGAAPGEVETSLEALAIETEGKGARLSVGKALRTYDDEAFGEAFEALLAERKAENEDDASLAEEQVEFAVGSKVFIEGVAILRLARQAKISFQSEYPMCPALALLPSKPATPPDEFAAGS
jgi:hypothetical protein